MSDAPPALTTALAEHDAQVEAAGLAIWVGAEPTFTDRWSFDPQWQTMALGREKEARARQFIAALTAAENGAAILRTVGRQYPGEDRPRWSYGIYLSRDGEPLWHGPTDPLVDGSAELLADTSAHASGVDATPSAASAVGTYPELEPLQRALARELRNAGLHVRDDLPSSRWGRVVLYAHEPALLENDWQADERVARAPLHTQAVPITGTADDLAAAGIYVVGFGYSDTRFLDDQGCIQVELPAFTDVTSWREFAAVLASAADAVGQRHLILGGHPPPVDASVAWTTVTPDPGVLEINMAPSVSVSDFFRAQETLHAIAQQLDLSPEQLRFNGEEVDSGGGQHLTFGGPTSRSSPFFLEPQLLPRLLTYLNRHPALSYWFAAHAVGSCGQQPRSDEVSPESIDGLGVALARLRSTPQIDPETLWRSLSPFLCDRFGNTHRCEANIEKLWNPYLPGRGCLGLVELRAFRMTRSAAHAAAVITLMRSVLAMLAQHDPTPALTDWGRVLHDRFALPHCLRDDLDAVLDELDAHGFGLHPAVVQELTNDDALVLGSATLGQACLTLRRAIEFWPVVGDPVGQDSQFRLMDASTARVELTLSSAHGDDLLIGEDAAWRLTVLGCSVPWVRHRSGEETMLLRALRYKAFEPQMSVSHLLDVLDPLEFFISCDRTRQSWRVRLFSWQPDGEAYAGLPATRDEARRRRGERLRVEAVEHLPAMPAVESAALSEFSVDLRRLAVPGTDSNIAQEPRT